MATRKTNMRPADLAKVKNAAVRAAKSAGSVLLRYYGKNFAIKKKTGAGIVTTADVKAEQAALKILTRARPDFGIVAEESAPLLDLNVLSEGRWIIDPLDGTTNFAHGFPMFCVSLAAEWQGKVIVGVIYHPIFKEMYVAVRGRGATMNGKKIRVSKTRRVSDSLLTTGFSYMQDRKLHHEITMFERMSTRARAIRRPGSAAMDLAYTARGIFDGFWERGLKSWDIAAGMLLVEEAGGKVTDFRGNSTGVYDEEILASNGIIHKQIYGQID